jgi:L,D-peptidoglycan transpeptidase YkuD (ErfK/YbiS/YcfS/YnhG family)|tara:strand:+ start:1631 stop:2122 length:492 start_codon:yes stop_codon:yes gene_type:complete
MNIKLKNKFLYFDKYRIKCSIGKRGITSKKREGDHKTPSGEFTLKSIFYRKDRIKKIKSKLNKIVIKNNMGWCDDPNSKYYNKKIKFPFSFGAEKLWLKDTIYDLIIVINYNLKPVIKNKGSAIFIHISKKNYKPTKGCIAITKSNLILLISKINKRTKIIIN